MERADRTGEPDGSAHRTGAVHAEVGDAVPAKFRQKKELATMGQTIAQRIAEQAAQQATREATREALETVLVDRFGTLPEAIQQRLATTDAETMRRWLKAALHAAWLEEVGILAQEPRV
jgi:hypothetical protein